MFLTFASTHGVVFTLRHHPKSTPPFQGGTTRVHKVAKALERAHHQAEVNASLTETGTDPGSWHLRGRLWNLTKKQKHKNRASKHVRVLPPNHQAP